MTPYGLKILPFPDGNEFALSFVDDTDFSTVENTKPVYDFLHAHGFLGTKTVWVLRQKRNSTFRRELERPVSRSSTSGQTLEDRSYLDFVVELRDRGYEIALHGVSAGNSYREEILKGLERFRELFGKDPEMNIFHQRNIDNMYAGKAKLDSALLRLLERILHNSEYLGHVEGSPYFWGDVALERIKYMRLPFHTIAEPNCLMVSPSMPFRDPRRPYVNGWFCCADGSNCRRFNRLLAKKSIDRLQRQNGACIIYTHFANGFVDQNGKLDGAFVAALEYMASRKHLVWSVAASELLDRLRAFKRISVVQKGRNVRIVNSDDEDFRGLTLKVSCGVTIENDGIVVARRSKDKLVIDRVAAGSQIILRSSRDRDGIIKAETSETVSPAERRRIEYLNYFGLIKSDLLRL